MKKRYLIFLLLGTFASCDKKNDNTPNVNSYPMTVGTQWTYNKQTIFIKYESETSDKVVSIDTTESVYKVWIDKDTIINNKTYKVFKSQQNGITWETDKLKFIDSEGLKFLFKQSKIDSELVPYLEFKFPLKMNSKWTFNIEDTSKWQISREVIGIETIHEINQNFNCYKVNHEYSTNPPLKNFKNTEWISEKGMIKKLYSSNRMTFTNQDGELLYFAEMTETTTLKELIIK